MIRIECKTPAQADAVRRICELEGIPHEHGIGPGGMQVFDMLNKGGETIRLWANALSEVRILYFERCQQ